jgi:hypothetical protein
LDRFLGAEIGRFIAICGQSYRSGLNDATFDFALAPAAIAQLMPFANFEIAAIAALGTNFARIKAIFA